MPNPWPWERRTFYLGADARRAVEAIAQRHGWSYEQAVARVVSAGVGIYALHDEGHTVAVRHVGSETWEGLVLDA
jgi:hypothetical protein